MKDIRQHCTTENSQKVPQIAFQRAIFPFLLALLVCVGVATFALASDVSDAGYRGRITISNNGSDTANVSAVFDLYTQSLIDTNKLNSSANDCAIQVPTGTDVPFMPGVNVTSPWVTWVPTINEDNTLFQYLYTFGVTGGEIRYFPDTGGMATEDNPSMEPGANFTFEQSGWWDTSLGANKNAIAKADEFRTYISATGTISSTIGWAGLDFVRANSDWVSIPDHNDFSFTDGGGNDEPFSVITRVNLDDATSSGIVAKFTGANDYEWLIWSDGADALTLSITNNDASTGIGRKTAAITGYEGDWIHIATTYDASEVVAGIDIYINGEVADTTNIISGVYAGMSNTNSVVEIGSYGGGTTAYLDGGMTVLKIYDVELSQAQVQTDFNGGHKATDLVAFYELDEGVGLPQDSSGNNHHATSNLADWFVPSTVNATGVASGEHIVTTTANITHMWIDIDGSTESTIALAGDSITDTSANWTFLLNNVMPYMEYQDISVNGTQVQYIDWEYSTTFSDNSGYGNDASPTFRTTTSDASVSANLTSFIGIMETTPPPAAGQTGWNILPSVPDPPTGFFTEFDPGSMTFWGSGYISEFHAATGIPLALIVFPYAFGIAIGLGFLAWYISSGGGKNKHGRGSLLAMAITSLIVMIYFVYGAGGVIPGWILLPFGIEVLAFIVWRQTPSPF